MPIARGRGSARQSMRRVIHRQGYLKKLPNAAKFGARFKVKPTSIVMFLAVLYLIVFIGIVLKINQLDLLCV